VLGLKELSWSQFDQNFIHGEFDHACQELLYSFRQGSDGKVSATMKKK
jgi:hypothetical protein